MLEFSRLLLRVIIADVIPRVSQMKLSIRYFAWAPLLIVALVISYGLVESLQSEPCPEGYKAWIAIRLIAAAFALYFFAGYWLVVTRKYVTMTILTLWAWHLLILSPFLATECSEQRSLDQLRQAAGFGFWEFAIAMGLVATASSFALVLRYRTVNGLPAPDRRTFLRLSFAGATVVSIALAAGAYWIVPFLHETFARFGADLPAPTLLLLDTYQYWVILPLACAIGFLYIRKPDHPSEDKLQIALNGAVGLIILLNVASSAFVFSALAPIKTSCGCVV
jgi:hypothetical protein